MIEAKSKSNVIATGLAMFSMFFGAGNVVFPLTLGQSAQDQNIFAIMGLLITAVGVPFLGLMSMSLFDGDYKKFFARLGKVPGFLIALVIMGLIGPFGALPRCIALSYSTSQMFFPSIANLGIEIFSIAASVVIFLLTFRKNRIVDLLGYVLTPILLGSLAIIIVKGVLFSEASPASTFTAGDSFLHGLKEGYQTMDLLGAFFFSSVVISCLKKDPRATREATHRQILSLMAKASLIGASLLALVYIGFSFVAAFNADSLKGVPTDLLLGQIAMNVLGPYAGIVACVAVTMACLTTAIALACVFAEFLHYDLTLGKLGYIPSLLLTLFVSYFIAVLNFNEIARMLAPILQILYPSLIVLSLLNLFYKVYKFEPIIIPVLLVLGLTLIDYFFL